MLNSFSKVLILFIIFVNIAFAEEAQKKYVYILPVQKVSGGQPLTKFDLEKISKEFLKSYEGKYFWDIETDLAKGVIQPKRIEAASSTSLPAQCYRCRLGRYDLINKDACEQIGYLETAKDLSELKQLCR